MRSPRMSRFLLPLFAFTCAFGPIRAQRPANSVDDRIPAPAGFERSPVEPGSFAAFLRALPLKSAGAPVLLYDGSPKPRQDVHAAVIDMSTGDRDLQQCADAVMRLRAEYLFRQGQADRIAFDLTNGFRAEWRTWRAGSRIRVHGNTCTWVPGSKADTSHTQLLNYLSTVFMYAGSLSLQRELDKRTPQDLEVKDVRAGDVFIHGGSPGHAMIVVDVAHDAKGRTVVLLAQSYMPAQDIHVVKNLRHPALGAWFVMGEDERLFTPEWTFEWKDLRRW